MEKFLSEIIKPEAELYEIGTSFYSVYPEANRKSDYDTKATLYDFVIGNTLYNKLIWGNSPSEYNLFCEKALNSKKDGVVLDAGCGSLVFTAKAYSEYNERPVVLLDRSLVMLKKAEKRLKKLNDGSLPKNIVFIQADIFDLPFSDKSFTTINSHGVLHVFEQTKPLLDSLARVTDENGELYLLVLLAENLLGKIFTKAAKLSGEIALSLSLTEMKKRIENSGYAPQISVKGNIGYIKIDNVQKR